MGTHQVQSSAGQFELVIDEKGVIAEVVGPWPDEGEFTIEGPIPDHVSVEVPDSIREAAAGREVCHYDPVRCRTCYCDEKGGMRCYPHC